MSHPGEDAGESSNPPPSPPPPSPSCSDDDDALIGRLIDSEPHHAPRPDYLQRCRDGSIDVTARQDSINWILRVHAHHHFRPITAVLSVNYLDRFLSSHSLPRETHGWAIQLVSVACLSLAAKMEEPEVPLLLELQVFDPKYVFEPRTVQRMELRVMSALDWRLRSVTPFDFLPSFIAGLPHNRSPSPHSPPFNRVPSTSSDLIVSAARAIDFLGFTPSTLAAAAVLCAAGEGNEEGQGGPGPEPPSLLFHRRLDEEMVRSCRQLMEEYLVDTCPSARLLKTPPDPAQPAPPSPVGVLDAAACRSCDTRSADNACGGTTTTTTATLPELPPPSPPPPPNKRLRSSASDVQDP